MKDLSRKPNIRNNSGFITAEFLFAFVMVIGIGMFIFAFTFSLATVEISQYIIWSTARAYASANISKADAFDDATAKFNNLTKEFPLLTGVNSNSPWFTLTDLKIGDDLSDGTDPTLNLPASDRTNENRQPWTGASAQLQMTLFANMHVPFLGKVSTDPSQFKFPVRAFLIRQPSQEECRKFFYDDSIGRFSQGIKELEKAKASGALAPDSTFTPGITLTNGYGEDNGC